VQQCLGCSAFLVLSALAAAVTSTPTEIPAVLAVEVCFIHSL